MWRSIPNFTQTVQQTVTDNSIDNKKLIFVLKKSAILSEQIFTPLTFPQPFIKNLCTELHENPTNGLVANTMARTEGSGFDAKYSQRTSRN
jgi:hypothetical protein